MDKSNNNNDSNHSEKPFTSTHYANAQNLSDENLKLKKTLNDLINSATQNQKTQDRFFELELFFLESRSYDNLLKRLLVDLKQKLHLSDVELQLIDPQEETQQLIQEIYGDLEYKNLIYVKDQKSIRNIYQSALHLQLTQKPEIIQQLFEPSTRSSKSVAMLPLMRANQLIGSLHLGSRDINRFHDSLATNFLQHLSSIVSVCIENSINQERYIHLSLVDMLTRAKNRRYFFQAIAKEIARSSRSLTPLSCLFIDIDHFKLINDQRGHLIGDITLREVTKTIQPQLRQSDVLARFGGEEFTVILADCETKQAMEIAERIRLSVADMDIPDATGYIFKITISVGVCTWYPDKSPLKDPNDIQNYILSSADGAVYQAKADGRNCVKLAMTQQQQSLVHPPIKRDKESGTITMPRQPE